MEQQFITTICDSTLAAIDLWALAKTDLPGILKKLHKEQDLGIKDLMIALNSALHLILQIKFL